MDKDAYKIITEVWKYLKKYIPQTDSNDEAVWDGINSEIHTILALSDNKPEFYKTFVYKICDAAHGLLFDMHFNGRNKHDVGR